ncbi:MAG: cell division protein FtsQ/DivIB [Terriglobia bacterium]
MDILQDVPLPQELGLEAEPPYRRRQKTVAVRRRRFATAAALIRFGLVLICIGLPSAFGLYKLAIYVQRTPLFVMNPDQLEIDGNHDVSRAEVLSALRIDRPLLERTGIQPVRLDLNALRSRVEAIPWVESATLIRAFPDQLQVRLVERQPVGFVNVGGAIKLIDREGVILEPPGKARFDFPVFWGLDSVSSLADRKARVALYGDFQRQTTGEAAKSGWIISEVDLTDAQNLKALLVQGSRTVLAYFGQRKFAERFHRFVVLMPQVISAGTKVGNMDLRYPDQVVVNPAGSPPPQGDEAEKGQTRAAGAAERGAH